MKTACALSLWLLALIQWGSPSQQSGCPVQGPPNPYGPLNFVGQGTYNFDYWSHAGTQNGQNFYQVGTKNLGPDQVTIDWPDADYFRRGIAPGKSAPGECKHDGNRLNTSSGLIKYGPNANYRGPTADFYTRSGAGQSSDSRPASVDVEWEAILDSGEKYLAAVAVTASSASPSSVSYVFTNKGKPIAIEWPSVLTEAALGAARRQDANLVPAQRLVLRTFDPARFTVNVSGQSVASMTAPLSIFTPEGLLLYRDDHRVLTLVGARRPE